ncbi:MAG TPA: peptidoglycan-associated lipoprotein Pal [Candidatus Hydrogenedentes bacterium]|nr:peptidoglycan-associated lipoprotein Pal [Candidatus Hydrogenedentota bacterium]HOL76229.1 peptidoglycan-associated lipoprotein Pal [Candidatus Hydrogenedentota bacterium]HPO86767.1 peptidoglycan-associated lipoprotein Pal [Candidatus Hydrogenedentota bacterium]
MEKKVVWIKLALVVVLALSMATFTGCKRKQPPLQPEYTGQTGQQTGTGSGTGLPDVDVSRILFDKATGLQPIYFDYDKYNIRPDQVATINQNADKIKKALAQAPNTYILIEGHCDERGTQEYNMALGERRALAVRDYLINLGVPGQNLLTISYGEERPVDPGHNEAAWAKNRRAEFSQGRAQ